MLGWINSHGIEVLIYYFIFASIAGGMPTPPVNASIAYRWVFGSLTMMSAGAARILYTQFPNILPPPNNTPATIASAPETTPGK